MFPKDILLLFDLDGTLVETDNAYIETWKELLDPYGYNVDLEWFEKNIKGKSDTDVFHSLFPDRSYIFTPKFSHLSNKKDEIFSNHLDKLVEIPGAINFIKECIEYEIDCGIVTNCNRKTAEEILKKYGLDKLPLTIGSECNKPKPYPDPYLKAMETFGKNYKTKIIFEDSPIGIQSAKASGVDYVIGIGIPNKLLDYGASFCIQNFKQLNIFSILEKIKEYTEYTFDSNEHLKKECKRILGESVEISKSLLKGGYIANIHRITTNSECFVVKRENESNHTFHKISQDLMLYEREYYFYENFSKLVPLKVPKYFGTVYKDEHKKGIVIENLDSSFTFNPKVNDEQLELIIKRIAEMHNQFLDCQLDEFVSLHCATDPLFSSWYEFCSERWPKFKQKWNLNQKEIEIGENILTRFKEIQKNLSTGSLTLVHGDMKLPNIAMSKNGEPYFLDWQYIVKGKGIQDVAFLMIESFELEDYEKILTMYKKYCDYTESDFKDSICYFPFYVAMWFGTVEDKDLIDSSFPKRFVSKLFKIYNRYF